MRAAWWLGLGLGLAGQAEAGLRQRIYIPSGTGGQESILHWDRNDPITLSYSHFSGQIGEGATLTTLEVDDFATLVETAFGRWLDDWVLLGTGLSPGLSHPLSSTPSVCEHASDGALDGRNNVLLSSRLDSACGSAIVAGSGVVGLTGVRYFLSTGRIAEADMQFNDLDYKFVVSGKSNFAATPKEINLPDVLTHEVGHLLGLDHSASRESTMLFSVVDGQDTPSVGDLSALYSLYEPNTASSVLGSVQGSVTRDSKPVFGAFLTFLNARTLETEATEVSNLNGAFQACQVPEGPQVVFARAYTPAEALSHFYYSGRSSQMESAMDASGKCYNPGCQLLEQKMQPLFWSKPAQVGLALKIVPVRAGELSRYLNLEVSDDTPSAPTDAAGTLDEAANLDLDTPLLEWIGSSVPTTNADASSLYETDVDWFRVPVPNSGKLSVRTAALSIYSRLGLTLTLSDENGLDIDECEALTSSLRENGAGTGVEANPDFDANTDLLDPGWDCEDVGLSHVYLRVKGDLIPCKSLPASSLGCPALSPPLYLISAYDPEEALARESLSGTSLASASLAASTYKNLPSCEAYTGTWKVEVEEEGGCCGTLGRGGPGGPNAFWSFLLSLLLSPLAWFAAWWTTGRRPQARWVKKMLPSMNL